MQSLVSFALLASQLTAASASVLKPRALYSVPGTGVFTQKSTWTFTGSTLPSGLQASDYTVTDTAGNPQAKYDHSFIPGNVKVSGGYLQLKVPGGQTKSPITCAEVTTSASNILYASARINAILTSEPGVVDGNFFYKNDCQEIDIEYLSDRSSQSNPGTGVAPPLQYTNQALDCNHDDNTHTTVAAPSDATTASHEYRIDWTKDKVVFYTDGTATKTLTTNVPTEAGTWIWNIWTNGDPGFTVGPPKNDAIFKISSITLFYNTTSS